MTSVFLGNWRQAESVCTLPPDEPVRIWWWNSGLSSRINWAGQNIRRSTSLGVFTYGSSCSLSRCCSTRRIRHSRCRNIRYRSDYFAIAAVFFLPNPAHSAYFYSFSQQRLFVTLLSKRYKVSQSVDDFWLKVSI